MVELVDGYVPVGTKVEDVADLERLLSQWRNESDRRKIGGGPHGRAPLIRVSLRADRFDLNVDTTRLAVLAFLAAAERAGGASGMRWHVIANRNGKINKVSYLDNDDWLKGWNAYLKPAADAPRPLG